MDPEYEYIKIPVKTKPINKNDLLEINISEIDEPTKEIGKWKFHKTEIQRNICGMNASMDISEIIQTVHAFMEMHLGKIPDIEKIMGGVNFNVNNLFMSENTEEKDYQIIEKNDKEIGIIYELEKEDTNGICSCSLFDYISAFKTCSIKMRIIIAIPLNDTATIIIREVINNKVKETLCCTFP